MAFVLRAEPVEKAAVGGVSSAHAQVSAQTPAHAQSEEVEERPLEARFDLGRETEIRGDQVGRLEEARGDAGEDSDYEGRSWW